MNIEVNTIILLGVAQLVVIFGIVVAERLLSFVVGSGSISDILANTSKNITRMRISNLVALGLSFSLEQLALWLYIRSGAERRRKLCKLS